MKRKIILISFIVLWGFNVCWLLLPQDKVKNPFRIEINKAAERIYKRNTR